MRSAPPSLLRLHRLLFLYMFCWPERGSGLDLLGRRSVRPCRDGARATSPRGPRLHGQRRRADCAASTSASCGARIRRAQVMCFSTRRGRARATPNSELNCDSTCIWLDSLATRQSAVPNCQSSRPRAKWQQPRSRSRSISSATKQAATGRRHASWRPRSRPKQKQFAAARASMATCGGGERAKRRAGQRAPSVLRRATPERELIWIHVDGNQSGRGARLGATASTTPS